MILKFGSEKNISNWHVAHHDRWRTYRTYLCNCMPNIYLRHTKQLLVPRELKGSKRYDFNKRTRGVRRHPGFFK